MATGTDQAITPPRVLLTGASSQIGVFAIPRLISAGFNVLAVSRKGRPEHYPAFKQVEWLDQANAMQASVRCQYLLSAGPLELAKKFLAKGRQFQTVVVFSSSSVENKWESADSIEQNQMQSMLALESELQQTARNRRVKLVILRPTLIYGCGLDNNISRLVHWVSRFGFIPVNGKAKGLRQPVHADDLAKVAVAAMVDNVTVPQILPLAGGSTLTYSDMVITIFTMLGKPSRLVRLPQWLFVLLIRIAGFFKFSDGINAEMVKRQQADLVVNDQQARELLNYNPRPFAPDVDDFLLPEFKKLQTDDLKAWG